jgi:hypothetical protein
MSQVTEAAAELKEIERWFADRGLSLKFREIDGEVWADLAGRRLTLERFGGGSGAKTELDAARSAQDRYRYQEESPPPLPRRLP